jgi:hypothetical protein
MAVRLEFVSIPQSDEEKPEVHEVLLRFLA